jgi:hypothetical protein
VFAAAGATFLRFVPKIKARYDYGMVIFILTFCLVTVSAYRVEELLELAHQRLSTIIIGASTCMVISIFVCPVWAGADLHKLVASNIEKLANYLEGKYNNIYGFPCFFGNGLHAVNSQRLRLLHFWFYVKDQSCDLHLLVDVYRLQSISTILFVL